MENHDELVNYSIPQLLRWRVKQSGDKVALREKDFGRWNAYTWSDYYDHVRKAGLGLEKIGFKPGDKIAIIGDNIPELLFVAVGAQAVGGISAGLYQSSLPDEIEGILNYMGVSLVFCDDQEQVDKLREIRERIP
ncbi:MAG: AMP-binding protein, partial [Desulfobacterales bacterium]|nr:AMP-binding protein [Desulfobacterales bacterium]